MIQPLGDPLSITLKDLRLPHDEKSLQKELIYLTAINWKESAIGPGDLQDVINDYSSRDDVWSPLFLDLVLLLTPKASDIEVHRNAIPWPIHVSDGSLPDGPYVIQTATGGVYKAGKWYEDTHAAFVGAHAAVKSRLYQTPTSELPLAGLRFAVKDIIDVQGMQTSCGNPQYGELYGLKQGTAACVQRLLDAGAELIGKTKSVMFADGANSACKWTHTLCPFNPRGDGYQSASSSSTGSAVACAAYEWIDFTIGTDTGGSVRYPAAVAGVYGTRPSSIFNCEQSRKHTMLVSSALDTVGVLARDSRTLRQVTSLVVDPRYSKLVLRSNPKHISPGTRIKILYPVADIEQNAYAASKWFSDQPGRHDLTPNPDAAASFETFVSKLESILGTQRIPFDFADLWRRTHPPGISEDINEAFKRTYRDNVYYQVSRNVVDPFIRDWKDTFRLREPDSKEEAPNPFIIPTIAARMDVGREVTEAQYSAANETIEKFSKWVKDVLFKHFAEEDEKSVLVLPRTWGLPQYRFEDDEPPGQPVFRWFGFQPPNISGFSPCPDFTIPLDEVSYQSKVTGRREWLPVSVGLLTMPEDDGFLFDLVDALEDAGVVKPQMCGLKMYREERTSRGSHL